MTTGIMQTKNTKLFFVPYPGSSSEILKVACATGITGLGGPADQIPTECLESEEGESIQGLKRPAAVTVPINFIARSAAHQALIDLDASGDRVDWMIVLSDAYPDEPTTLDSNNYLVSPGPTTVRFQGYIADLNLDIGTNEIVRGTVSIQRTGAKTWDLPAADLP